MTRTKAEILAGTTKPVKSSRVVANNTVLIHYEDDTVAIRLHDTDVVTSKGHVHTLSSGGWLTPTTKDRINRFSPANVQQVNGVWYVGDSMFYDGIQVDGSGSVISEVRENPKDQIKEAKRRIREYTSLLSVDNLPLPNGGDCWYCHMVDENGETMGDHFDNTSHLENHLDEGYIHGSILVNAMREAGYRDEGIAIMYSWKDVKAFKRALKKYLTKRIVHPIITQK